MKAPDSRYPEYPETTGKKWAPRCRNTWAARSRDQRFAQHCGILEAQNAVQIGIFSNMVENEGLDSESGPPSFFRRGLENY